MTIVVLLILFILATAAVAYPLLSRQASTASAPAVTDRDIERALRRLRDADPRAAPAPAGDLHCPACAHPYVAGDRFCVKCGADLPAGPIAAPSPVALACPACGASLRAGDVFCSKCGHRAAAGEEV
jgi:hypothetical protein